VRLLYGTLYIYREIAVYLLAGLLIASLIHVFVPETLVRKQLGGRSWSSVFKAALFGIPLPLCSCGVIPVTAGLRKAGASRGAAVSFLIATPQIGADSFLITYSLLGIMFGIFRVFAAFITACTAGVISNFYDKEKSIIQSEDVSDNSTFLSRLSRIAPYLEYSLLGSIAKNLVIGIIVAGAIQAFIPDGFFTRYIKSDVASMLLMLAAGIPMYVCASSSTPIAASLIFKGISPGAALVFLLTGPATNAVTISSIMKSLGKKTVIIYLTSIIAVSFTLGMVLNSIETTRLSGIAPHHTHSGMVPAYKTAGAVLLSGMLLWYFIKTSFLPGKNK